MAPSEYSIADFPSGSAPRTHYRQTQIAPSTACSMFASKVATPITSPNATWKSHRLLMLRVVLITSPLTNTRQIA